MWWLFLIIYSVTGGVVIERYPTNDEVQCNALASVLMTMGKRANLGMTTQCIKIEGDH